MSKKKKNSDTYLYCAACELPLFSNSTWSPYHVCPKCKKLYKDDAYHSDVIYHDGEPTAKQRIIAWRDRNREGQNMLLGVAFIVFMLMSIAFVPLLWDDNWHKTEYEVYREQEQARCIEFNHIALEKVRADCAHVFMPPPSN